MSATVVDAVKALAWPVAALIAAVMFYRPICSVLEIIAARATKFSLFKIEIELLPAAKSQASTTLDDIKDPELAPMNDSSQKLFEQAQDQTPADYALIDIGAGDEWLTSRLFVGAAMLERMRGVKSMVFVGPASAIERRVLAVVPIRRIRWALAQRQPWLEAAYVSAETEAFSTFGINGTAVAGIDANSQLITSITGGLTPMIAKEIVRRFVAHLQNYAGAAGNDWVDLSHGRRERAAWVTAEFLRDLLPSDAFDMWIEESNKPNIQLTKAVLRKPGPFVALVNAERQFLRLIDRQALLEKVVGELDS